MPFATNAGARLYWKLEGASERPALLLLHSIGTDMSVWDGVARHLLQDFRLLRMDLRGHGASDAPNGDYAMAVLAADASAVLDAAGLASAAVAGVSLGGMIGMELAVATPSRVSALALICTSAEMDRAVWEERIARVREGGTAEIADVAMARFLSPEFLCGHPATAQSVRSGLIATASAGYAGAGAAIRDMDLIDRIHVISAPTVVVAGSRDVSTPFLGHGERIADKIVGAHVVNLDAAHLAPLEAPIDVAAAIRTLLRPQPAEEEARQTLFEAGLVNRRRILGDDWVDASLASRTNFNADFQAIITRIAWHEIWGRPGLDERTRRLIVVAITAALGSWEEFRLHVRTGLERGGFTRDELKEVLMQAAIYAGVPAANTAFAEAAEILASISGEPSDEAPASSGS